ncbi:MAG TPA: SPOR domain-containing protein [Vicinamibacterales bacterium]|nr:SPOR domain-containing protein [Vicinamibacterales bacterium]
MSHDSTEDGFHEIQLSGKQLLFVMMTLTVLSVAIFLCGIVVGRSVSAHRGIDAADTPAVTTGAALDDAAGPPAVEPPSPPEDELSYHQRLQGRAAPEEIKPAPARPEPQPPAPAAAPPPQETGAADARVPTAGRPGTWVVQVTALQNRATAAGIVQRLIAKGYPAFLENPAPGAPAIYRVRIGRYGDRKDAEQIARRIEKEEQFTPVVTR